MKRGLLHEQHNRQEKAQKPDYREDMKLHPKTPVRSPLPLPRYKIDLTLRRNFRELAPPIVAALHRLEPRIDLRRLVEAINSRLGETGCKLHCELELNAIIRAIRGAFRANQAPSPHISARFLRWHDQAAAANFRRPSDPVRIPDEFHAWLHKLAMPPKSASVTASSTSIEQLRVCSSPQSPAL